MPCFQGAQPGRRSSSRGGWVWGQRSPWSHRGASSRRAQCLQRVRRAVGRCQGPPLNPIAGAASHLRLPPLQATPNARRGDSSALLVT